MNLPEKKAGRPKIDDSQKRNIRLYLHVSREELKALAQKAGGDSQRAVKAYLRNCAGLV